MTALQLISTKPNIGGSVDKKLGIIALRLSCWAPDLASAILSPAPDPGIAGLVEWQPRTFSRLEAGDQAGYDVECTLEGHAAPDTADDSFYELEGSTSDDPIETHWNLDVLLNVYSGKFDKSKDRAIFKKDLADPNAGNAVAGNSSASRNPMFGVQSWSNPGMIWTRNWVAPFLPDNIVQELGTVSESLPGHPRKLNNPPGTAGGRNWLCVRVRGRQRGNIWQLGTSYALSGPFGWVPEMYRST